MTTRIGKIARLPKAVREELNRRLQDGETGGLLLDWLNAQPRVQAVLQQQFGGVPISKQNLSEWRQGGHRDWLRQQDARDLLRQLDEQAADLSEAVHEGDISGRLATVLAAELAGAATCLLTETTDPAERWKRLRELLPTLTELRRDEHRAARLRMDREAWEFAMEQHREEARERSDEEVRRRAVAPFSAVLELGPMATAFGGGDGGRRVAGLVLELLYDLPPGTFAVNPDPVASGSNPVQPNPTQSNRT